MMFAGRGTAAIASPQQDTPTPEVRHGRHVSRHRRPRPDRRPPDLRARSTTGGAIDWFCAPRFDSPSVFGSLLDQQKGGQFSITPVDTDFTTKQLYFPDTGVLITRFMAECGVAEIHDFMPIDNPAQPSERHRIVRMVKVPRGEVRLQMEVAPRFDYGRAAHTLESTEHGAVFTSGKTTLTLHSTVPLEARENDVVGDVHAAVR